jgi:hypothetical protein
MGGFMPVARAIVLLTGYREGDEQLYLPQDAPWYVQYFFNPDYGLKGYWLKQTDNDVLFDGEVSDWAFYPPGSLDVTNRTSTAQTAVVMMGNERGIDFSRFDMVIVVLGVPRQMSTDGGSTEVTVGGIGGGPFRRLRAVVMRVRDRFDFVAHETGHGLGLKHSFGSTTFQTSGEGPGGYGHPHCIMSAMSYGGISGGGPYFPTPPRDGRPEYSALGPSLNAVTALGRRWVDGGSFRTGDMGPTEFDIRSRHFGGRNPGLAPQAVEVLTPSGDNYVIEFRERAGWDMGQGGDYLIIAQGRGAVGEQAYQGAFVGTYASRIELPVTLGGLGHVRNFPGFGLQVLNRSTTDHTLKIRLHPGKAPLIAISSSSNVETLARAILERGETTWAPGEKICVEGTFPYTKVSQRQRATFEATCGDGQPPVQGIWTVDGQVIPPAGGPLSLTKKVQLANPKLETMLATRSVALDCQIEPLPNGSRLRVTSDPANETFHIDVKVELQSTIGSATETFTEEMAGVVYDYGDDFEQRRTRCLTNLANVGLRYPTYEVLPDPEGWRTIPPIRRPEFETLLAVLGHLKAQDDGPLFERTAAELSRLVMSEEVPLKTVALDDRLRVDLPARIDHQPGPILELDTQEDL